MRFISNRQRLLRLAALILVVCAGNAVRAQSSDVAAPSPVRSSEVMGTISARDIGDPRLTDHYYVFTGTPGDVLITVDSRNLNGDIDVFTFTGLRPLLKVSVYSSSSAAVTKSIYLRKREDLILRVEARSPNDDEGTYRIRFGGSFEPITSGPLVDEQTATTEELPAPARAKKGRRVSSVGARIDEPVTEVAATPTPEPTPAADVKATEPNETRSAASESVKAVSPKPAARPPRGRRGTNRRTRTTPPKVEDTVAKAESPGSPSLEEPPTPSVATPGRRTGKRGANTRASSQTETQPETATTTAADSGPRLVIETTDGTLINRYMSSVRRVTVENNQVVVVGKDGKIDRIPLTSLLRMTIAP